MRAILLAIVFGALASAAQAGDAIDPAALQFFETRVRPVLADRCYSCHSAEAIKNGKLKADLLLDSREGWLKGGKTGPEIDPGHPEKSRLIEAIKYTNQDLQMPPKNRLSPEAVVDLEKWVSMGAPDPRQGGAVARKEIDPEAGKQFWSFQPLHHVEAPALKSEQWPNATPIDQFLLAKMTERKLAPNPIADRRKLIRRAYFDLLGLPPSPEEVDQFVADPAADAWPKLLDRLLASPRYGERWARHWLDQARFAESDGFEFDESRPGAYHYRDFVIRALNDDMPFDRFAQLQIAGDEMAPDDLPTKAATGFLTAGTFPTQITEREFESTRYTQLDDMIGTIGTAFLGVTVGCARCHDHKYDPVAMIDYYRMVATFATAVPSDVEVDIATPQEKARFKKEYDARVADLKSRITALQHPATAPATQPKDGAIAKRRTSADRAADLKKLKAELAKLERTGPQKKVHLVRITSEGVKAVETKADGRGYPHFYPNVYLLRRGDPNNKVEVVTAAPPRLFVRDADASRWQATAPEGSKLSYRRTAFARWLTDVDHGAGHLTARVIVNRLWQHHFGQGIVTTPSDFGAQGDRPTHPELLDWLAGDLVSNGWTLKRMHKLIMTSSAYMQTPDSDPRRIAIDPRSQYCWRWQPRRLEAEPIRDSLLSVAGVLDETMYGPGTLDQSSKRRSIYFTVQRARLIPMLMVLDWPEPLVGIGARPVTTVAPQALLFMNSAQARGYAEALAKRVHSQSLELAVGQAYRIAYGRDAVADEIKAAGQFIARQSDSYIAAGKTNAADLALSDFCQALLSGNEFVYVD